MHLHQRRRRMSSCQRRVTAPSAPVSEAGHCCPGPAAAAPEAAGTAAAVAAEVTEAAVSGLVAVLAAEPE